MAEKSEDVATDEYGMIEVRTLRERVDFLTDTLDVVEDFFQRLQADWDHTAVVAGQLDFIEQNIVDYWTKEGLPADVCHGRHPAADASKASELGLSWTLWRYAQDARSAIAEADSNRAFRVGWLMGRLDGERHMARRHGRNAWSGRRSVGGGTEAAEKKWADLKPMHQAWIARDCELSAESPSQRNRAKKIAEEWPGQKWNTIWCFLKDRKKNQKR